MPVEDIKYGEFKGRTEAHFVAVDKRLTDIEKSLRVLHSKNGWKGAIRPGMIGTGGAGLAYAIIEALKVGLR